MNSNEASTLLAKQTGLWPEWTPNEQELLAWTQVLAQYPVELADKAFTATWAAQRSGRSPRPSVFTEQAKVLAGRMGNSAPTAREAAPANALERDKAMGYCGWWCVCMLAPEGRPVLAGQYRTITFPDATRPPTEDRIAQVFAQLQDDLCHQYPGSQWSVYRDCTWYDIQGIVAEARRALVRPSSAGGLAEWKQHLSTLPQPASAS